MFSLIKLTFTPQTREIVSRGLKTRNDGVFGEEGGLINSSFLEAVIRKSRRPFRGAWKLARYINVTRRRSFYDSVFSHRPVTHRRVFSFHRPSIEEREARISSSWTRDNRPLSLSLSFYVRSGRRKHRLRSSRNLFTLKAATCWSTRGEWKNKRGSSPRLSVNIKLESCFGAAVQAGQKRGRHSREAKNKKTRKGEGRTGCTYSESGYKA